MAKLKIPIHVYMEELEEIINELKDLQTYKLAEGDDKILVDCDDVIKIFANHLRAEVFSSSMPRRGEWIVDEKRFGDTERHCSLCGAILEGDDWKWRNNNYCYHCGARMMEGKE